MPAPSSKAQTSSGPSTDGFAAADKLRDMRREALNESYALLRGLADHADKRKTELKDLLTFSQDWLERQKKLASG